MDLGAYFREFSNLSLIASQLENVGWGQIGVNFLFLLTVLRVNKFFLDLISYQFRPLCWQIIGQMTLKPEVNRGQSFS